MWAYNQGNWTWMSGDTTRAFYSSIGEVNSSNIPPPIAKASFWSIKQQLYFYGGEDSM